MKLKPDAFIEEACDLAECVVKAFRRIESVEALIEESPNGVFLEDHSGVIVACNSVYTRTFGKGLPPLGRSPDKFLDNATAEIAKVSARLLSMGCRYVAFDHTLDPSHGNGPNPGNGPTPAMILLAIAMRLVFRPSSYACNTTACQD